MCNNISAQNRSHLTLYYMYITTTSSNFVTSPALPPHTNGMCRTTRNDRMYDVFLDRGVKQGLYQTKFDLEATRRLRRTLLSSPHRRLPLTQSCSLLLLMPYVNVLIIRYPASVAYLCFCVAPLAEDVATEARNSFVCPPDRTLTVHKPTLRRIGAIGRSSATEVWSSRSRFEYHSATPSSFNRCTPQTNELPRAFGGDYPGFPSAAVEMLFLVRSAISRGSMTSAFDLPHIL